MRKRLLETRGVLLVVGFEVLSGCSSSSNPPESHTSASTGSSGKSGIIAGGSAGTNSGTAGPAAGKSGSSGASGMAGSTGSSAGSTAPHDGGSCLGASQLAKLGKTRLVVGAARPQSTAEMAAVASTPLDLEYVYISGGIFDGPTPCTACDVTCSVGKQTCDQGCGWWGCYNTPPGMYAGYFLQGSAQASPAQIPMFTYYELLQTVNNDLGGSNEGSAEVMAATNVSIMTSYFADWRFLLQQVGQSVAVLHIEPDFWGYAQQVGSDPTMTAAAVATANTKDCGSLPNTIAGMGQCMVSMVRTYAPNALVALHASAWAAGADASLNTDTTFDVAANAQKVAAFLRGAGGADADLVIVETSDRDAGYYQVEQNKNTFWDTTNATLPNFHQDFAWVKALTEALGVPAMYWQNPLGNANQTNTANHWKDNRVDYFFANMDELAAAHVIGAAFGAGDGSQTTPGTDGGNFATKAQAYVTSGGQALCP
jgi:hypothetical protein